MRSVFLVLGSAILVACCALLAKDPPSQQVPVRIRIVDAESGKPIGGMIRVYPEDKAAPLVLPGLLDRLRGLSKTEVRVGWHVVPVAGGETSLPEGKLRLEAVCRVGDSIGPSADRSGRGAT